MPESAISSPMIVVRRIREKSRIGASGSLGGGASSRAPASRRPGEGRGPWPPRGSPTRPGSDPPAGGALLRAREKHDAEHDEQGLSRAGRQDEGESLYQVVVDPAALLYRGGQGGEVVVGEDDVRRLPGDVRARHPHRRADAGLLEGGSAVDAVAGHGHDLAPILQALHEPELVLG